MNKMISQTGKIVPLAVLAGVFWLFLKQLGCSAGECCMIIVTVATAIITYQNNQQNKVGIEASQRQAEAATEQTKAIQQQIEISKQQTKAAEKQADIARKELEEAQKQREEAYRPRLVVYFEKKNDFTLQLVIENFGNAPAYDIDVSVKAPWEPYQKSDRPIFIWNTLEQKYTYLAAKGKTVMMHNEWSNFYNCTPIQLFLMQVKPLEATLQYRDRIHEKPFTETSELYLSNGEIADTTDQTVFPPFLPPEKRSLYTYREYIKAFLKLFEHGRASKFSIPKYTENVTRDLVYTHSWIKEIWKPFRCNPFVVVQSIFDLYNAFIEKIEKQIGSFNEEMKFYNTSSQEDIDFCHNKAYPLEFLLPHLCNKVYFVLKEQIDKHPDKSLSVGQAWGCRTYKPEEIKKLLEEVDRVRKTDGNLWKKIDTIFKILGNKQVVIDETHRLLGIPNKKDLLDSAEQLYQELLNRYPKLNLWISKPALIPEELKGKVCILMPIYIACKEFKFILQYAYDLHFLNEHLWNIKHILNFLEKTHVDKKSYLEQALKQLAIELSDRLPNAVSIDPTQHWFDCTFTKGFECDIEPSALDIQEAVNSTQLFNPEYETPFLKVNPNLFLNASHILQTFFERYKDLDLEHYKAFLTTPSADTQSPSDISRP